MTKPTITVIGAGGHEERARMLRRQAESWARAEASWPKPKFRMVGGVKVFDSIEDYYND